jgi:hypothetical protein
MAVIQLNANENYEAGQFAVGSLTHFTLGHTGLADSDMEEVYKVLSTKGTPVIIGAIDSDTVRVAVENANGWTAAELVAALGDGTNWTVVDFAY